MGQPRASAEKLFYRHWVIRFRSIAKNQLVARVAVLGSGTAFAQLANILATPILTHIYLPADFGEMAIFMGIVVINGSMANLCYEAAIILPEDKNEARRIGLLSLIIAVCSSILLGMVFIVADLFFYSNFVSQWWILLLMPAGIFSLGAFNVGCNWRMRSDDVRTLSIANIIRTLGALLLQLLAGLAGFTGFGLIVGRLFGQISATLYVFRRIDLLEKGATILSLKPLKETAKNYSFFPIFRAPQSLLALVTEQIPAFALGFFFGPEPAGLYWIANRILKLPCTILSEATAKVYYSECARRHRREQSILPLLIKTVSSLASIAIIPSLLLFLFAPELFSILGAGWRPAGDYGCWLTIWMFFVFCCSPIMMSFAILEKQNVLLLIDIIAMVFRVLVIFLSSRFNDEITMIAWMCIFESVKIIMTALIIFLFCQRADRTFHRIATEAHGSDATRAS